MSGISLKPLKGRKHFAEAFKEGERQFNESAIFIITKRKSIQPELANIPIEYGLIVPKKTAKKAVVRNRIKRLLRESLRIYFSESDNAKVYIEKLIIIWRTAPKKPSLIALDRVLKVVKVALKEYCGKFETK